MGTSKEGVTGANEGGWLRVIWKRDDFIQFWFSPVVEARPLSNVPCVFSTCIKETFISPGQIINTLLQKWEGRGLALEEKNISITVKSCLRWKGNRQNIKVPTSKSSGWLNTKVFVPRGAYLGDFLSGSWPFSAQEFSTRKLMVWEVGTFVGTQSWSPSTLAGD